MTSGSMILGSVGLEALGGELRVRLLSVTVLTTWSEAPPGISASISRVMGTVALDAMG